MVPTQLEDWILPVVMGLVTQGYSESDKLDFKEMLPHSKGDGDKLRLRKTCAAFANSNGGFLIFGVKDNPKLPPNERIVGVSMRPDFFADFGDYPRGCTPSVDWTFLQPSIRLTDDKFIHIIHIPRSWQAPHWLEDPRIKESVYFPKRTNKGNEPMSHEEVKMAYLQFYEKRLKLRLLRAELDTIRQTAKTFIIPARQTALAHDTGELGVSVIETVLADTYTLLASRGSLLADLGNIRQFCRMINAKTTRFYQAFGALSPDDDRRLAAVKDHNYSMNLWSQQLESTCVEAMRTLDEVIGE